jgi:SseB protein N-terminal domain
MTGHGSGGPAWSGRELTSAGFEGDVGSADAKLVAALDHPGDETALMAAVAQARLLVPIVATPRRAQDRGEPMVTRSTEVAVVTLTLSDGQRGFPVFSSLEALSAWDPSARPSPVTGSRAAAAAVAERCEVMLIDLGSAHEWVLRPSMVWALAQQRDWLPAHADPFVARALVRATLEEEDVIACTGEGDPAGAGILHVVLSLRAGLDAAAVQALATRIGERIATDGETRARIDGLSFTIAQA